MSDWNTMHLFDSKKFYFTIGPQLKYEKLDENIHINSKLYSYLSGIRENKQGIIDKLQLFLSHIDKSFKFHSDYKDVLTTPKKKSENHQQWLTRQRISYEEFWKKYDEEIYHYTSLMTLILFSECAQFNPHLIIGRRIFQGYVKSKKGSIARECIHKLIHQEIGGFYSDGGYIINWLTHEEVEILWHDRENLIEGNEESKLYYLDFLKLLKIAFENQLGLLTVSNINEHVINLIESPKLKLVINMEDFKSGKMINFTPISQNYH